MITIDDYWHEKCRARSLDMPKQHFFRELLLELPSRNDVLCSDLEELKYLIIECFDYTFSVNEHTTLGGIAEELHDTYLLAFDYKNGKPLIYEVYDIWVDLKTNLAAAYKPCEDIFYTRDNNFVHINDYRVIENLQWHDLTRQLKERERRY